MRAALAPLAAAALALATASAVAGSRGRETASPTTEARDCCAAVSPDGATIAFIRDPIGQSPTFVVTIGTDGTGEAVLGRRELGAGAGSLTWSPDGTHLAFESNYRLFTVRADGTGIRRVASGYEYAWSPDGTMLAVNAEHFGGPIVVYSAAGRRLRTLTRGPDSAPAWSPDGRWIAFLRSSGGKRGGVSGLYVVRASGGRPRRLAPYGRAPSWMPDGRITYVARRTELYAVTIAGQRRRLFALPAALYGSPSPVIWSSDGSRAVAGRFLLSRTGRVLWQLPRSASAAAPVGDASLVVFDAAGDCANRGIWTGDVERRRLRRLTQACLRFDGSDRRDLVVGSGGADRLRGFGGADVLRAGPGNDVLRGGDGIDLLDGGGGADLLYGDGGGDRFVGGTGNDFIFSRDGEAETVDCGAGYQDGAEADASDRLTSCEFNAVRRP